MKVKTVHYVDGINVADMTDEELVAKIADAEGKIKSLRKIETESTKINQEIARVEAFIADVVKHLDARAS
ncbi:MAG: hypothetical protein PVI03_07905 [Candidatus Thorarchaeota archaeon]|jgi:hypothetical protein